MFDTIRVQGLPDMQIKLWGCSMTFYSIGDTVTALGDNRVDYMVAVREVKHCYVVVRDNVLEAVVVGNVDLDSYVYDKYGNGWFSVNHEAYWSVGAG